MAQHIVAYEDTTGYAPASDRWCAYDDSTYDGPGCPLGKGATEAEAVADLMEQIAEAGFALIAEERAA